MLISLLFYKDVLSKNMLPVTNVTKIIFLSMTYEFG